jgi:hypothetical protein
VDVGYCSLGVAICCTIKGSYNALEYFFFIFHRVYKPIRLDTRFLRLLTHFIIRQMTVHYGSENMWGFSAIGKILREISIGLQDLRFPVQRMFLSLFPGL